jgi:coenzyme F420-reducing hydrogenase delta subunit
MFARRRFVVLKDLLEYIGIEPGRVYFSWISSAEATKFQATAKKVVEQIKQLGPATRLVKNIRKEAA